MVKLRKEKILVSLVIITLITLVFGSVNSLATVIKPNTGNNVENETGAVSEDGNNTANNTNTNNIPATVGSTGNNTNNSANNTTNKVANSTNNTNTPSSKLPYAGSNSSMIFIVIALVVSALYAYKKVSDYNV